MPEIKRYIFDILKKISSLALLNNQKAYLVGGYIRDFILDRKTNDIDVAVTDDALTIAKQIAELIGAKYFVLDRENKVARLEISNKKINYHVDFSTIENNIESDLGRRDFTINAMAVSLSQLDHSLSSIIDPFKGRRDLDRKLIRAVNEQIFLLDPTRLLRGIRMAATLNLKISRATENLIKHNACLTVEIPGEQVRSELFKILSVPGAYFWIKYLDKVGILTGIIPELGALKNVRQPKEHYWDVFNHSLETVAATELLLRETKWRYNTGNLLAGTLWNREISSYFNKNISIDCNRKHLLKLAALLHDIAKPATKRIEKNGRMRFLGHPKLGSKIVEGLLSRLRLSNREIKIISILVYNHLRPAQISNTGLPSQRAIYRFFRDAEGNGIDILFLALADYLATKGPRIDINEWKNHNDLIKYIVREHFKQSNKMVKVRLVNGYDLMNIFKLKPGPIIGNLLVELDEAQASGELLNKEEAIVYIKKQLKKKHIIPNS